MRTERRIDRQTDRQTDANKYKTAELSQKDRAMRPTDGCPEKF